MNVILTISLRNLLRQKRRSILLGTAIAFGTAILLLANAFSHGISDVLFNRIITYVAGHVGIAFSREGDFQSQLFRDGERIKKIVRDNVSNLQETQEAIGTMARVIGNGKSDNCILVGIDLEAEVADTQKTIREAEENFRMIEGDFYDIEDTTVENPVIISREKAGALNVKLHDILRARFTNVHGQNQTARFTVKGVFEPANIFMSAPVLVATRNLKPLMGYGPHDIGQLQVNLKNPRRNAVRVADSLHTMLKPPLAVIRGSGQYHDRTEAVTVLGFRTDSSSLSLLREHVSVASPDSGGRMWKRGVFVSTSLAHSMGVAAGDTCRFTFLTKHEERVASEELRITGVFGTDSEMGAGTILLNEKRFYKMFYGNWPKDARTLPHAFIPKESHPLYSALAPEWVLLERSRTTKEMQSKYRELAEKKIKAVTVDVQTMYESASAVLNMEAVLNIITLSAVMILFVVIQIGVVNTLRMTVRERTREIGTVRAIGMQKRDVRNTFLLETLFLALIAALAGTILAFAGMWLLSIPTIQTNSPLGMLLVNRHLHFAPTVPAFLAYILLILAIAATTAWFPARRASNLQPASALRHFD